VQFRNKVKDIPTDFQSIIMLSSNHCNEQPFDLFVISEICEVKTTLLSFLFVLRGFGWAQQLEFQYTSQQLNAYNSLTNDIPLFTQNFDDQVSSAIPIVPFTIGGQAYNTLFVSTNGFITLGQAASPTNYNPILHSV
jgi:hypothetical protein